MNEMTQEELESNKLVATYIGASITNIPGIQKAIMYPVNGGESKFVTRLRYHKSMDWLYPVYQKIYNFMSSNTFEGTIMSFDPYGASLLQESFKNISDCFNAACSIDTIFKEIVEWIKIYNLKY